MNQISVYRGHHVSDNSPESSSLESIQNSICTNGELLNSISGQLLVPTIKQHSNNVNDVYDLISKEPNEVERYCPNSHHRGHVFSNDEAAIYVCGDKQSASVYANESWDGLVVEIKCDMDNIIIDGRDLLYNLHLHYCVNGSQQIDQDYLDLLAIAYGDKFKQYIVNYPSLYNRGSNIKFRLIDYICMDRDIIEYHYRNRKGLICGRYNTKFFSAFGLIGGYQANQVAGITKPESLNRNSTLQKFQSLNQETVIQI